MEDNRNHNGYDDFFKSAQDSGELKDKQDQDEKQNAPEEQEPSSYYYSYGPFRSQQQEQQSELTQSYEQSQTYEQQQQLYVQPHSPTYGNAGGNEGGNSNGNGPNGSQPLKTWQYAPRRRSWFSSFISAFLACALIMTGFLVAADHYNWLSNDQITYVNDSNSGSPAGKAVVANTNTGGSSSSGAVIRPDTIADMVENASPAVVKVETYVKSNSMQSGTLNDDFFQRFFGDRFGQQQPQGNDNGMVQAGLGTGFIFDKTGYILTNEHVVDGAAEIYVTVEGFKEPFKAELLGSDFDLDLAVLKISGDKEFATLPIGNSADLRVGDWVTAIGNPVGFEHTVSVGVLSAKERQISISEGRQTRNYEHLLQTDASINPGNSGGPLINMAGEVIGINTAVSTEAQGIGFAIPTSTITSVLDKLKNNQSIPKPYVGIGISNIDESWLKDLQLDSTEGALVTQLEPGSPADKAGIQTWDVILQINGQTVKSADDVVKNIQELDVNAKATMKIVRDGKEIIVGVMIGDRNG